MSIPWPSRHRGRRAISPILATILVLAVALALVGVVYILVGGLVNTGHSSPPIGSAVAFSPVLAVSDATHHWYNFSFAESPSDFTLGHVVFGLHDPLGLAMPFPNGSSFVAVDDTGARVAGYDFNATAWTFGGGVSVSSGLTLSLDTGPTSADGDTLVAFGAHGYNGVVAIPLGAP